MGWAASTANFFKSIQFFSPKLGTKRPREGAAEAEVEVEQPLPSKRRTEADDLPPLVLGFGAPAPSLSAARAKPGTHGGAQLAAGGLSSFTGGFNAPHRAGGPAATPTPRAVFAQSPRFLWAVPPQPRRHAAPPAAQPQLHTQNGWPVTQPVPQRVAQTLFHPAANRNVGGAMGLGGSKPTAAEPRGLDSGKDVRASSQPGGPRNGDSVTYTPGKPSAPFRPAAASLTDAAVRSAARPSAADTSWRLPFHERAGHLFAEEMEPTDCELDYKRKKLAADAAMERMRKLHLESAKYIERLSLRETPSAEVGVVEAPLGGRAPPKEGAAAERPIPRPSAASYKKYEEVTTLADPREVVVLHQRSNISIVGHDMASMAPTVWLNDEVINLYMSLLLDRDTRRREANVEGPRCHFFHSFFANNLYKDTGYKYGQVQRWTRPKKLKSTGQASASVLDCDRIIMPVHQGVHWVCAVIDLAQRKFVYYDSLGGEDRKCLNALAKYIKDEFKDKKGEERDDVLEWKREFPKDIPRQENGCDCGVFALTFAEHAARAAPMRFTQADMQDYRVQIVQEMLDGQVA